MICTLTFAWWWLGVIGFCVGAIVGRHRRALREAGTRSHPVARLHYLDRGFDVRPQLPLPPVRLHSPVPAMTDCPHNHVNYSDPLQCDDCKKIQVGGKWVADPDGREQPVREAGGLLIALGDQVVGTPPPAPSPFGPLTEVKQVELPDGDLGAYHKQRDNLTRKMGGLLPVLEGHILDVKIGQQGTASPIMQITLRVKNFDEIAMMAAPCHNMHVLMMEDRR